MNTTAQRGWIVSGGYDTAFFTASLLVPMTMWVAFSFGLMTGVAVYVTFQLLFNLPHNFQTWTMSVLEPEDRQKNGRTYAIAAVVILLVLLVPMVLSPKGVYPYVRDALIYWGYYHLVRQHYGFQRIYERKMGGVSPRESWWYGRFLDAVSYLPLVVRFSNKEMMTIHVGSARSWIQHPVLPQWTAVVAIGLFTLAIGAALMHHVVMVTQGRKLLMPRAMLLTSVAVCFGVAGMVIDEVLIAVAVVTTFHNIQYLALVYFHNRNRADAGEVKGNRAIGWLSAKRLPLYLAISVVYGLIIFGPRAIFQSTRLAELPLSFVVAFHYFVDARLWKFKDYPRRGAWLKLGGGPPKPAAEQPVAQS